MTDLSIIIPVHNEDNRLHDCLAGYECWLGDHPGITTELILVENGSTDNTPGLCHLYSRLYGYKTYYLPMAGKGMAIRYGMLSASGDWRLMVDCDWSVPPWFIGQFWCQRFEADILIGSRAAPGARRIGESWQRRISGQVFSLLARLVVPGLTDTQCGFKLFSAQAAIDLFQLQMVNGWAFDVELLWLARRLHYTIEEIPVNWHSSQGSKVRLIGDSWQMIWDLARIKVNERAGLYTPMH